MDKRNPHTEGAGVVGVNVVADPTISSPNRLKKQTLSLRYDSAHRIIVRPAGDGVEVAVEPPHPDYPPVLHPDYRTARGAAGGLRLVHRWQIVDECEGGA